MPLSISLWLALVKNTRGFVFCGILYLRSVVPLNKGEELVVAF